MCKKTTGRTDGRLNTIRPLSPTSRMGSNGDTSASWETKVAKKREAEFARIPTGWRLLAESIEDASSGKNVLNVPAQCGILTKEELDLTENYTATSLARAVQAGSVKAADVALAFVSNQRQIASLTVGKHPVTRIELQDLHGSSALLQTRSKTLSCSHDQSSIQSRGIEMHPPSYNSGDRMLRLRAR